MKKLTVLILSCLVFLGSAGFQSVFAADFRTGEDVIITEGTPNLKDMYLFGGNIKVNAPIQNDVVLGGGDITLDEDVSGSVMAGGGDITLGGTIGNTVRTAGGNIRIDSKITRDLIVAGGTITVSNNASIGQDLIFAGGKLTLEAPVKGKVVIYGGDVTLNSAIDGNVEGEVEKLTLGPNARIKGNLSYKSEEKAQIANSAVVQGSTNYTPIEKSERHEANKDQLITGGSIYKLIADIIISILLIYFLGRALMFVFSRMKEKPVESGAIGFGFIMLFPIVAMILFILIWLGVAAWLMYGLLLLASIYLTKIFVGWFVMRWWESRYNRTYTLDWKAGVIGPIIVFIVMLVPILGWIAVAIAFCVSTGALLYGLVHLTSGQKLVSKTSAASKKS